MLQRDPFFGNRLFPRNACALNDLAGQYVGLVHRALPLNLLGLRFALFRDAGLRDSHLLRNASLFNCFRGRYLGGVGFPLGLDPFGCNRLLLTDTRSLDCFARRDFGFIDGLLPLDFLLANVAFRSDARFGDLVLVGNPRRLYSLSRSERCLFGFLFAIRTFAGEVRSLLRPAEFDLALLFQARLLAFFLDYERLLLRLQVAFADADHRVLLDVVAQLAALLDRFHDFGQAGGVEGIGGIEEFDGCLVDVGYRDAFQFQTVLVEADLRGFQNAGNVCIPVFVQFFHRQFAGDGAKGGNELALQESVQPFRFECPSAEGRGGETNGLLGVGHADVKFRVHIDAHSILRDQRVFSFARHGKLHGVHIDRRDVVDDRPNECAAVDHNFLSQEAGSHERDLFGGAAIEPMHHPIENEYRDHRGDEPQDNLSDELPCHLSSFPVNCARFS